MIGLIPKLNKNSLFFIKYLGYYIVLLLIPLILLGSLIFYVYLDVLQEEIEKNNFNLVEIHRNSIDNEFSQIYSIYYQLYTDSAFSKRQIHENPIHVVETLSNYDSMNELTRSISVYPRESPILYTSNGTQTFESFLAQTDVFTDMDIDTFRDRINSLAKPSIKPAVDTYSDGNPVRGKSVSLMLPLPPDSKSPDRTVLFLIDRMKLISLFGSQATEEDEDFILLNSDKGFIFSLSGKRYDEYDGVKAFISEMKPGEKLSGVIQLNRTRFFISCAVSNTTGMYYIRILPEEQALRQLYDVRAILFYTSLLALVIGGIVILLNLTRNLNPIAELMRFSERILGHSKAGDTNRSSIKKAVGEVIKTYDKLESQLNKNLPAVKEHILGKILHGSADESEIGTLPDKGFFRNRSSAVYFASVVQLLKPVANMPVTDAVRLIEDLFADGIKGYCKPAADTRKLILLLSAEQWDRAAVEEKLTVLRSMLYTTFELETVTGVGNAYPQLSDAGKSFIEANSALDYRLVQGSDSIIFWSDVSTQSMASNVWYPKAELDKLEVYLLRWDSHKIEETVDSILKTVREKKISLSLAKCISYDMINTVIRGFNRINPSLKTEDRIELDIFSLTEIGTLDELVDRIVSISKKINEMILHNSQQSSAHLSNQFIEYLHRHCFSYDFTVEAMSEHFSLSHTFLRKVFKDATNANILSYVNTLRIEKAKELLKDTDMNLGEIVKQIGYVDPSSFVRKFKQETGMTPGDYRKVNGNF
ncbi:helix-turn-helix transcriptional regulator [Paenibacillus hemerocallicola]|uniref:Helix-turn-helix transcriptional regulator n=1 Tax=Paenibacillus hemerocallicola TaxID=1172614 RepID=A0A5C4TBU8_9BACL|nr:helix-turn-helix domain-containing protein [Paenibacillus hemerocallicola]TNJ66086.1 helix-turn-helix transcriptional regulator [Paenibacillus hemerocallicola]